LVVSGVTGNAGAGGVMLALAADIVFARADIVLNPHYKSMGLYGSEYWTYSLPRAVGPAMAEQLTQACLPVSAIEAWQLGMIQEIGPRCPDEFSLWLLQRANSVLSDPTYAAVRERKSRIDQALIRRCREAELEQMQEDMLHDRNRFAEKCSHFVYKRRVCGTPTRLVEDWARVDLLERTEFAS
jgi:putative two-component system hydrogenase maturation factor HypX/HoxX